jgi:hypothetical protein
LGSKYRVDVDVVERLELQLPPLDLHLLLHALQLLLGHLSHSAELCPLVLDDLPQLHDLLLELAPGVIKLFTSGQIKLGVFVPAKPFKLSLIISKRSNLG